jgi:hypothetical protein
MCQDHLQDSQVMGRTLRTLFTEGGRFAPYIEQTTFRTPPEKGKLLATVYHMTMNEPERYQPWLGKITNSVAKIVMGLGDGPDAFIKDLEGLQKTFGGETHIDALPEITRQALEGMDDHPEVLRKIGGIHALAGAGVDIYELLCKLQNTIRINAHAPTLFCESYHLIVEAIEYLHQVEFLNDEQRDAQRLDLATTCFGEIDHTKTQKWFDRAFWAKALVEIAPALPRDHYYFRDVLMLLKYCDPDPEWLNEMKLADQFDPEFLKERMKEAFPAERLYDAVAKLRGLHVYSENERLQMLANRFSNDLGL